MFCTSCGNELDKHAYVCPKCGHIVDHPEQVKQEEDKNNVALNIVGFLFPFIGLILYLTYMKKAPIKAKNIGICSLIGFAINLLIKMF